MVPLKEAEIVTVVELAAEDVFTVKVALVDPAAMVTLAGTVATAVLLLESATTAPPEGAAALSFTVPCELLPPATLVGLSVSVETEGGDTASVAVCAVPLKDAEIVTFVGLATEDVCTVKVALVAPAVTVTLAGTVATAVLLLESATTAPPEGAVALSVTVPCELLPPVTLAGPSASEETEGGDTVRVAVCVPFKEAEIVTFVGLATEDVCTVKVALVAPAVTVTLAGTVATDVLLLDGVTTDPPEGAGAVRDTVPRELLPPVTVTGFSASDKTIVGGG